MNASKDDADLKMVKMLGASDGEAEAALKKLRQRKFDFVGLAARAGEPAPVPVVRPPLFEKEYQYQAALADMQEQTDAAWAEADRLRIDLKASYESGKRLSWPTVIWVFIFTAGLIVAGEIFTKLVTRADVDRVACSFTSTTCTPSQPPPPPPVVETSINVFLSRTVVVRHWPTAGADVLGVLPAGTAVKLLPNDYVNDWTEVQFNNGEGYIRGHPVVTFSTIFPRLPGG